MPAPASYNGIVPKVTFLDIGRTVEFESGKLPYQEHGKPESLLDVALNFGIQLEHACGGSCACTTCHVIVREGYASLGEPDEAEEDLLDRAWGLTPQSRLSCQAIVAGTDLVIELPRYTINHARE